MKRRAFIKLSGISIAGLPFLNSYSKGIAKFADDENLLFRAFQNPDTQAKPFVRWWWNGLKVTKKEVLRELQLLKAAGVGGVEINSIRFPETADAMNYKSLNWLSDEWMDIVSYTVDQAKQLGLICDIIVGSGWPFGGDFIKREDQSMIMALGTKTLKGPMKMIVLKSDLEKDVDPPIGFKYKDPLKQLALLRLAPATLLNIESVVDLDLDARLDEITIDVPAGDHVLYYVVKITGFMAVIHGAPGADGPVLNHFKKTAVDQFLNNMSEKLDAYNSSIGSEFRSMFVDSLELEGANWVDDFYIEFEKRRQYSLKPYLPFILFKTGKMGKILELNSGSLVGMEFKSDLDRIRYDFEVTKVELFRERFLQSFIDWCKRNKVKSRMQAYGQEMDPLDSSLELDIPECETWISPAIGKDPKEFDYRYATAPCMINRFVSSAARFAGKHLISCEEITNTSFVFNASMQHIKITGDQSNLSGVTHSVLHGFNYSPPEAPFPGWVRYGTFFNERNPWWPYLQRWIAYKSRISAVFQRATLMSDVLVYHPLADLWSQRGIQRDPWPDLAYPAYIYNIWEAVHQCGSGCDYISDTILQQADVSQGVVRYNGRTYSLLLIVEVEHMADRTAKVVHQYAQSGGRLVFVGKRPTKSPGFFKHVERDKAVNKSIGEIMDKPNVKLVDPPQKHSGMIDWFGGIQKLFNLPAFIKFSEPSSLISQVYYRYKDLDLFFINNSSITRTIAFFATFNVAADKTAWIWDPESGDRFIYKPEEVYNKLKLRLAPAQSVLIVFDKHDKGDVLKPQKQSKSSLQTIAGPWSLKLIGVDGSRELSEGFFLKDFKQDAKLSKFGGTVIYETSFFVSNILGDEYIDLGKVAGITEARLNDVDLGVRWYGDYIYDAKGVLKQGENILSIKLVTTLGNYMRSIPNNKDAKKWVIDRNQPVSSMGIIGPVCLRRFKH